MARSEPLPTGDLYVGYRSLPASARPFVWVASASLLLLMLMTSMLLSASQRDPGAGVWDDGKPREFRGVFRATPYPRLIVEDSSASGAEPMCYLLVEMGKRACRTMPADADGAVCGASGWLLEREGRRIIELAPERDALKIIAGGPGQAPSPRVVGPVTLRGEIVDSKCYLGAMKPGDGKTHKACATLCIRGGIPPMLVTQSADGDRRFVLLLNTDGRPLPPEVWPLIGEPVEVRGELETWDSLAVLRTSRGEMSLR